MRYRITIFLLRISEELVQETHDAALAAAVQSWFDYYP